MHVYSTLGARPVKFEKQKIHKLTCRFYKLMVLLNRKERLSQIPEVLFQNAGYGCDICLLLGKVRA